MCRKVYKFQDLKNFETAFIVSDCEFDATERMKMETKLDFLMVESMDSDEFPAAARKTTGTHVIKNNIDLF